jgi:hypothetical protein
MHDLLVFMPCCPTLAAPATFLCPAAPPWQLHRHFYALLPHPGSSTDMFMPCCPTLAAPATFLCPAAPPWQLHSGSASSLPPPAANTPAALPAACSASFSRSTARSDVPQPPARLPKAQQPARYRGRRPASLLCRWSRRSWMIAGSGDWNELSRAVHEPACCASISSTTQRTRAARTPQLGRDPRPGITRSLIRRGPGWLSTQKPSAAHPPPPPARPLPRPHSLLNSASFITPERILSACGDGFWPGQAHRKARAAGRLECNGVRSANGHTHTHNRTTKKIACLVCRNGQHKTASAAAAALVLVLVAVRVCAPSKEYQV